jgi:hypothetical protein
MYGGERGIRTPGPFRVNGFQDRRIRPLCQLSLVLIVFAGLTAPANCVVHQSNGVSATIDQDRSETPAYYNHLRRRVIPKYRLTDLEIEIFGFT